MSNMNKADVNGISSKEQMVLIKNLSREIIINYWPDEAAIFDEYWPFFEKTPNVLRRKRRQGAAESWIYSPYLVGIVTGIASSLIIAAFPHIKSAISSTMSDLKKSISNYYQANHKVYANLRKRLVRIYGDHPDFLKVLSMIEDFLGITRNTKDGNTKRSPSQK